jgi:hypothetical protein
VIYHDGPWRGLEHFELATLEWVNWFNTERLLKTLGYLPSAEFEVQYHASNSDLAELVLKQNSLRDSRGDSVSETGMHWGNQTVKQPPSARARQAILVTTAVVLSGCAEPSLVETVTCPGTWSDALVVRLVDAQNGERAPFSQVKVLAVNGQYRDSASVDSITASLVLRGQDGIGLAQQHPGTFTITVLASGYSAWTRSGVTTVKNFRCAYESDTVVAAMRRP